MDKRMVFKMRKYIYTNKILKGLKNNYHDYTIELATANNIEYFFDNLLNCA